ncbi:MAG: sulfatase-like hydrolase/transferase [Hyphomonas sp.]|uniref:sulfatase-like hydrolase/transferase n=1 Tax=Hyphomonas sp. TaxID=87 RepID=UPI0035273DFD
MVRALLGLAICVFCLSGSAWGQAKQPNFLLVVVDDAALMDFGAYGGEASTPNIDSLATHGLLFTALRATPSCATSRAMLLTGLDNHLAGFGAIPEVLPPEQRGQPGYTMSLPPGAETIATKLKRAGYRNYMTGKWHLGHGPGQLPVDHGFDHSFVLDASGADHWEEKPYLPYYKEAPWFEDGKRTHLPKDFYSSTFIVEKLRAYLEADQARDEPFFAYVAFTAIHIPVQAPREYTDKYIETYRDGWDNMRIRRWQRAQELGLFREGARMADIPDSVPRWDALTPEQQKIAAGSLAVAAGALEALDAELGKLIAYLKESGQYDNTIILVTSDNGPEGGDPWGSVAQPWLEWHGYSRDLETLGETGSYLAIGSGGASAASGPLHLFKFHSGEGGQRVPLIIAGPGIPEGERVDAFTTLADIAPTINQLAGLPEKTEGAVPFTGRSLVPLVTGQSQFVYGSGEAVGFSTAGQSALYRGDYKLVRTLPPHGDSTWRLFNISEDPGETQDLSVSMPDLKSDLMQQYRLYADRVGVLELPPGYDVERQITLNTTAKLWQYYWPWVIAVSGVAIAALAGIGLLLARAFRRRKLRT